MKKNMSKTDGAIRILAAIVLAGIIYTVEMNKVVAIVLGVVAIILVITSMINFCPLYTIFGINTCKKRKK